MRIAVSIPGLLVLALLLGGAAVPGRVLDWEFAPAAGESSFIPSKPPAYERVIEVVDRIPGGRWDAAGAASWLDRHTSSRMKVVKSCTGKAYRCITVKAGRVGAKNSGPAAWSSGSTITIDTAKAAGRYGKYYRHTKHRRWLIVHELGHQFGLTHTTGRNVMNDMVNRYQMKLTASQRSHLKRR